jgi:flavin-dependent dehydrogenase
MAFDADTIVLGAGPAGSTVARLLAADGISVLLLDRAAAPVFKVGESLLPEGVSLCRRMGMGRHLEEAGFLGKYGAHFILTEDGTEERFDFLGEADDRTPPAYEVKRVEFDALLARFAAEGGARLLRGFDVEHVDVDAGPGVAVTSRDGRKLTARFLVDATGPAGLLGQRLSLRDPLPGLRKAAIFSHFADVPRASGRKAGDIIILHSDVGWHWVIPFSDGTTSVGIVGEPDFLRSMGADDQQRFDRICERTETHRRLLGKRRQLMPIHRRADYSFRCRTFSGERFLLVGDAAGFVDPIFSNGVFLAQKSAFLAHDCLGPALKAGTLPGAAERARYEKDLRVGLDRFVTLVRQFYDDTFAHNIVRTRERPALKVALTGLLAGGVWDEDNVWIRMGVV